MIEKDKKRAQRRHQKNRIRAKRKGYLVVDCLQEPDANQRHLGMLIKTPKPCSCWMCGNPRKHFGEKSLQERKADEKDSRDGCP